MTTCDCHDFGIQRRQWSPPGPRPCGVRGKLWLPWCL